MGTGGATMRRKTQRVLSWLLVDLQSENASDSLQLEVPHSHARHALYGFAAIHLHPATTLDLGDAAQTPTEEF